MVHRYHTLSVIAISAIIVAFFPSQNVAQTHGWEAVPGVHAGYAAHMLDLGDGYFLFSGPSSHIGRNGHGLFFYTPGNTALRDVTPSWAQVHALARTKDNSVLCANEDGIWRTGNLHDWTLVHDTIVTALDCLQDGYCYATEADGSLLRSTDHGATWSVYSEGIKDIMHFGPPRKLLMDGRGRMICALNFDVNLFSLDHGLTWQTNYQVDDSASIWIVGEPPFLITSDSNRVINGSLYVLSHDWIKLYIPPRLIFDWRNQVITRALLEAPSGVLYAGFGTTFYGMTPRKLRPDTCGIIVSYDQGDNWTWFRRDIDVMNMIMTDNGKLLVSTTLDGFLLVDPADGSTTSLNCSYGYVTDLLYHKEDGGPEGNIIVALDSCHVTGTVNSFDHGAMWSWSDTMSYVPPNVYVPTRLTEMPDGILRKQHGDWSDDAGKSWKQQHLMFKKYPRTYMFSLAGFTDGSFMVSDYDPLKNRSLLHLFDRNGDQIDSTLNPGLGRIRQLYAYDDENVYAAAETGLYLTTDRGSTFQQCGTEDAVSIMPIDYDNMAAGIHAQGVSYAINDYGGSEWSLDSEYLGGTMIDADGHTEWMHVLVASTLDSRGVGASGGRYSIMGTTDRLTWFDITEGLPTNQLTALCYDDRDNMLYVGTRGCGVFRKQLPVVGVRDLHAPTSILSVSAHPQPCDNVLTLRVDYEGHVPLEAVLYDVLGRRQFAMPVPDAQQNATRTFTLPVAGLRSGAYFLVVTDSDRKQRRVLPILKQ
ncbi:MAG: hypothetical protein C0600_16255 [Ignavibacteria bacterium]|nr:MAG: hypothetical protein C0600_16255 [Ignavibacteria bacterium]